MSKLDVEFLRDIDHGGEPGQPKKVAQMLAEFVAAATTSLHLAIYDFRLGAELAHPVVQALTAAAARGVEVRIAYDHGGKPDPKTTTAPAVSAVPEDLTLAFADLGGDPAPVGTHQWLQDTFASTSVQLGPIDPGHQLMHNKYLVRDGATPGAVLWTGSTNFTDDAWSFQDNNIIHIASPQLAAGYERDFTELWTQRTITHTGAGDDATVPLDDTSGATVGYRFAPGEGPQIDAGLTDLIEKATGDIAIASMVLTSKTLLHALVDALGRGLVLSGVYDAGQMGPIAHRWQQSNPEMAELFTTVSARLVGKHSLPYTPTGKHNFMHNKVLVTGDTVSTGSFNFSANATRNSENNLILTDPDLAQQYRTTITDLVTAYTTS